MPDSDFEFSADGLLVRLGETPRLLKVIGAFLVALAQDAFRQRRLGGKTWPTRYASMPDPFINIAAAVRDLNQGGAIKGRRFRREPVLMDTGALFRGINFRVVGNRLLVGFSRPTQGYGSIHQFGGESSIPVTQGAREGLTAELRRAEGEKKEALKRLGFIYSVSSVETDVAERPIFGWTRRANEEIPRLAKAFYERKAA